MNDLDKLTPIQIKQNKLWSEMTDELRKSVVTCYKLAKTDYDNIMNGIDNGDDFCKGVAMGQMDVLIYLFGSNNIGNYE